MRNVKPVKVGDCVLDGKHIYIQSMLNVPAENIEGNVKQAVELEKAGCEIIRTAVPDMDAVQLIPAIKEKISIPLVADIHFDYRLALKCAEMGVDKIRINPGNIGDMDKVRQVAEACQKRNIPIRIGCQFWFTGKGNSGKIRLTHSGSPRGKCLDSCIHVGTI